jgi:SAM-dependent methyltransferase
MSEENAQYNKGADGQPVSLEAQTLEDGRRFSPSVGRNRDVVRQAFRAHMPARGRILEIGSGTGEHGVHMTAGRPDLRWTFTDIDEPSLASAKAWRTHVNRTEIDDACTLDASASNWGAGIEGTGFDGLFSANVIHISPIAVANGLFAGAGRVLGEHGRLFLYGPFARDGEMSEGDAQFDADLKRRNPAWGVRDLERQILPMAREAGFQPAAIISMPKNNLSVVFERS